MKTRKREQSDCSKMDQSNDHESNYCKELAHSFSGRFKDLPSLSEDCCIYGVPPKIRMLNNKSLYTPRIVSIGPLHYGRKELKAMEEYKLRYLKQFRQRTQVSMENFLEFIKEKEVALRNCYADTIKYGSKSFVEIIFLDAVFLIEMFLRGIPEFQSVDRVFSHPGKIKDIVFDIMLLDNQLPMFILQELFEFAKLELPEQFKGLLLSELVHGFLTCYVCQGILLDPTSIGTYFSEAKHFVDLLRLCLQPPEHVICLQPPEHDVNKTQTKTDPDIKRQGDCETAPNITKLHQSGITFELASDQNLLGIKFERGTLKIPKLTISNMTMHLFRNLHMFESLHCDNTNFINDYHILLHRLLSTPQDVELLIQAGVLENRISNSEGVSTLFRELSRDARANLDGFYYSGLVKDLQDYSRSKRHKWTAILRQKYFSNPWVSISVIAASVLLILTFIQTVCSVIGLRK